MSGQGFQDSVDGVKANVRLSEYMQGQKGKIIMIQGNQESRQRMSEMGFTKGAEIEVVKAAPLTDPIEYIVKGYHVSLRREQAAHIIMEQPNLEAVNNE